MCLLIILYSIFINTEGQKAVNVKRIQESLHLLDTLSVDNGGNVKFGGWWKPENCKPRSKVSLLVYFNVLFSYSYPLRYPNNIFAAPSRIDKGPFI